MKKFLLSLFVGSVAGISLGILFLVVVPKLPDVFAEVFYKASQAPSQVALAIKNKFQPATNQFFIPSVDATVAEEGKVAYADLGAMKITLFENGEVVGEYPIASVGREGTAWQTPIGQFDMSYKKENHFSSIGHVWMPYSMHFFGNYFIHGWPYYPDGTPVADGYSGGCIRLKTDDAKAIFAFVDSKTKLVVTTSANKLEQKVDFEYQVTAPAPQTEANFLVADLETGEVVEMRNATSTVPSGAFANIMTGLISLETLNQYQETVLDQEIMHVSDLLYALVLQDNPEAGTLLQGHKNKNQYLLDMNTRAKSLGMSGTNYKDVTGELEATVTTLEDTFKLMQYIQWYKPFLMKVLSLESYKKDGRVWEAVHPLKNTEGFIAGFSNAENTEAITMVDFAPANEKTGETKEKKFIIIVQGSADAGTDTLALYAWLAGNVKLKDVE